MLSKEDLLALEPDFIAAWYSTFSDKRLGDVDFWHERSVGTYMALNSGCRGGSGTYQQTVADECQDILTLGMIFDVQDRAEALVAEIQGGAGQYFYLSGGQGPPDRSSSGRRGRHLPRLWRGHSGRKRGHLRRR